jgi:hypothetical protein
MITLRWILENRIVGIEGGWDWIGSVSSGGLFGISDLELSGSAVTVFLYTVLCVYLFTYTFVYYVFFNFFMYVHVCAYIYACIICVYTYLYVYICKNGWMDGWMDGGCVVVCVCVRARASLEICQCNMLATYIQWQEVFQMLS